MKKIYTSVLLSLLAGTIPAQSVNANQTQSVNRVQTNLSQVNEKPRNIVLGFCIGGLIFLGGSYAVYKCSSSTKDAESSFNGGSGNQSDSDVVEHKEYN